MMETEYMKSMHSNFARILLDDAPDERKYQYCILNRGGIRGLLPCNLRRIDNQYYLYYDITSHQNIAQLFRKRRIDRRWVKDFLWSLKEIQMELDRFLLNDSNILWYPEHVYQDMENNVFLFMYMPYYSGENGFIKLLDFILENLDYEDEELVEIAYKMYGKYEENGDVYLQGHIFEDAKQLEESQQKENSAIDIQLEEAGWEQVKERENLEEMKSTGHKSAVAKKTDIMGAEIRSAGNKAAGFKDVNVKTIGFRSVLNKDVEEGWKIHSGGAIKTELRNERKIEKRKLFPIFDKKQQLKEEKEKYRQALQLQMEGKAVAEETVYGEDYGRTCFVERQEETESMRRLYTPDEKIVATLEEDSIMIGKYEEEVDVVVKDPSVSRIHARITKENGKFCIEDMNSTNGTAKNGLRLKPYEKKLLNENDIITLGKVTLVFR